MKFIKASERLPEDRGYYFVITTRNRKEVYNWHSEENSANTWENEVIEWLDETPQEEWISVEDRLPEVGVMVLVNFLGHIYESKLLEAKKSYLSDYSIGNKFYKWDYFTNGCRAYNVTHWMPLPPAPGSNSENKK